MLYNIDFNICSFILIGCILLFFYSKKQLPIFQNKVFCALMWVSIISITIDTICAVVQSYSYLVEREVVVALNIAYFFFRILVVLLFLLYTISLSGSHNSIKTKTKWMVYAPTVVLIIALLLTPKYQIVFSISEDCNYNREKGIFIFYAVVAYYVGIILHFIIVYRKIIQEKVRKAMFSFVAISVGFLIIQFIFPRILVESFGISLCVMLMYMSIQRPEEMLDIYTNVLNEKAFITMIPGHLAVNKSFCVITLILEDTQLLSSTFGVLAIQNLIVRIGDFLKSVVGKGILYKISPYKYSIIINDIELEIQKQIVENIQSRFLKPWVDDIGKIRVNSKLVIIHCPKDAKTLEEIVDFIETAETNRNTNEVIFAKELESSFRKRVNSVKRAIIYALENQKLEVYYQPIYCAKSYHIKSAEALVRLYDEQLGAISPEEFIPIAEQFGLITKVGEFVFESVCKFIKRTNLQETGISYIEVNISAIECMQDNIAGSLMKTVNKYGIEANQINLEVTESAEVYALDVFVNNINELKTQGFSLSLDDYGTGYSTINYIINLPFDIIKIDKSIVWEAFKNEKARDVVESVIMMIKKLNIEIVAEGVETVEQANVLASWGCEFLQGYYFSKPIEEQSFFEMLQGVDFCNDI